MNKVLQQYIQQINSIQSKKDITDWIIYGDWMLLTTNRAKLAELQKTGELTEQEENALRKADNEFKLYLTFDQLKQLTKQEPKLPIEKWWGN